MKRAILLVALCLLATLQLMAQQSEPRKKYINLGFSNIETTQLDSPSLKSNFGASFTVGKTFFVHKNPIASMIHFGIDATWFDINYTNYKIEYRYTEQQRQESEFESFHQAELGVQFGPSVTITPLPKLNAHAYFRYAPSFSALYDGGSFQGGYASYFVGGASVSYGVIGLGVEARFGGCTYSNLFGGESDDKDYDYDNYKSRSESMQEKESTPKSNFSGMRVYLTFRF